MQVWAFTVEMPQFGSGSALGGLTKQESREVICIVLAVSLPCRSSYCHWPSHSRVINQRPKPVPCD